LVSMMPRGNASSFASSAQPSALQRPFNIHPQFADCVRATVGQAIDGAAERLVHLLELTPWGGGMATVGKPPLPH
jgi:hypothetical protein